MRIIRYKETNSVHMGVIMDDGKTYQLPDQDFLAFIHRADSRGLKPGELVKQTIPELTEIARPVEELELLVPIVAPEVWAAGVTYERSREARNAEMQNSGAGSTSYYDKVYEAERPEIFFKSTAARTRGPNEHVSIRSDSSWQVPEPELGLVIDSKGRILGYTVGNDMSCRDIEGENPLYLPQAKVWRNSCAIGPAIRLADTVEDPYDFTITCRIYRDGVLKTEGSASTRQLKRKYDELVSYLLRDNLIFDGTVLLTGTCIVPPDDFTLQAGDRIDIEISGIGTLSNEVTQA